MKKYEGFNDAVGQCAGVCSFAQTLEKQAESTEGGFVVLWFCGFGARSPEDMLISLQARGQILHIVWFANIRAKWGEFSGNVKGVVLPPRALCFALHRALSRHPPLSLADPCCRNAIASNQQRTTRCLVHPKPRLYHGESEK